MALGLSAAVANDILDAIGNNSALTTIPITTAYIKLHTGDPGASATSNAAGNTTRKSISFGSPSGGAMTNDADITWSTGEVTTSEDYTHFSVWDASTAGNFIGSGTITANAVTAGDQFTIASGDLSLSLSTAA